MMKIKKQKKNNSNQYYDAIADIDDPFDLGSSFGAKRTKFEKTPITVIEDFEYYKLNNPTKIDTKSENKLFCSTKSDRNLVCDNEGHMIPEKRVTVNLSSDRIHQSLKNQFLQDTGTSTTTVTTNTVTTTDKDKKSENINVL